LQLQSKNFISAVNTQCCVEIEDSNKMSYLLEADIFLMRSGLTNKRRAVMSVITDSHI